MATKPPLPPKPSELCGRRPKSLNLHPNEPRKAHKTSSLVRNRVQMIEKNCSGSQPEQVQHQQVLPPSGKKGLTTVGKHHYLRPLESKIECTKVELSSQEGVEDAEQLALDSSVTTPSSTSSSSTTTTTTASSSQQDNKTCPDEADNNSCSSWSSSSSSSLTSNHQLSSCEEIMEDTPIANKVKSWSSTGNVHKITKQLPEATKSSQNVSEEAFFDTFQRAKRSLMSLGKGGNKRVVNSKSNFYKRPEIIVINQDSEEAKRLSQISQDSAFSSSAMSDSAASTDDPLPDLSEVSNFSKAYLVAREMLSTEQSFHNDLQMLSVNFKGYITKLNSHKSEIVPQDQFELIFCNMDTLLTFSHQLSMLMRERLVHWHQSEVIADIFVKNGDFLKIYGTYTEKYESNRNLFEMLQVKYPKFKKAVEDFQKNPICQNMNLASYFLKPTQRLMKYHLFLDNYIKHLHPGDPDYENAAKGCEIVNKATSHVNELMQKASNAQNLLLLQERLVNFKRLIRADRLLLKEGKVSKNSRSAIECRYLILLNDCLLVAKPLHESDLTTCGLNVKHQLCLMQLEVTESHHKDEYPTEFHVKALKKSFIFRADTVKEKDSWIGELKKASEDCRRRRRTFNKFQKGDEDSMSKSCLFSKLGHAAPVWTPDGRVTMCALCCQDFTMTFRKHHCRACGKVVCRDCSSQKAPLRYKDYEPDRVCTECFDKLFQELGMCDTHGGKFKRKETKAGSTKSVPSRLRVSGTDEKAQMRGYLYIQQSKTSLWRKVWIVLKASVLYEHRAPEDGTAVNAIPILGYKMEAEYILERSENSILDLPQQCGQNGRAFRLTHINMPQLLFYAENENTAQKWLEALHDAISG